MFQSTYRRCGCVIESSQQKRKVTQCFEALYDRNLPNQNSNQKSGDEEIYTANIYFPQRYQLVIESCLIALVAFLFRWQLMLLLYAENMSIFKRNIEYMLTLKSHPFQIFAVSMHFILMLTSKSCSFRQFFVFKVHKFMFSMLFMDFVEVVVHWLLIVLKHMTDVYRQKDSSNCSQPRPNFYIFLTYLIKIKMLWM